MSGWRGIGGNVVLDLEHTCNGSECESPVNFDRAVPLKSDGMVRLEGTRHDGAPIHHYVRASDLPGGAA